MAKQFNITGQVLGNLWMGGRAAYPMKKISAPTRAKALKMANDLLKANKLTGTGDFNGEIGALLQIECVTTRMIGGKLFTHSETGEFTIGEMTEKEEDFLVMMQFR